jgi:hypothetical protein
VAFLLFSPSIDTFDEFATLQLQPDLMTLRLFSAIFEIPSTFTYPPKKCMNRAYREGNHEKWQLSI